MDGRSSLGAEVRDRIAKARAALFEAGRAGDAQAAKAAVHRAGLLLAAAGELILASRRVRPDA
jgi:hypothetical protein